MRIKKNDVMEHGHGHGNGAAQGQATPPVAAQKHKTGSLLDKSRGAGPFF